MDAPHGLPGQSDVRGVPAEGLDVLLHPLQAQRHIVHSAETVRLIVMEAGKPRQFHPVPNAHEDHTVLGKTLTGGGRIGVVAFLKAAAVDVHQHWQIVRISSACGGDDGQGDGVGAWPCGVDKHALVCGHRIVEGGGDAGVGDGMEVGGRAFRHSYDRSGGARHFNGCVHGTTV